MADRWANHLLWVDLAYLDSSPVCLIWNLCSQMAAGVGGPTELGRPRQLHHHMSDAFLLLPWPLSPGVISFSRSFLSSKVVRLPA